MTSPKARGDTTLSEGDKKPAPKPTAIKAKGEYLHDNTIKVKLAGLEYSVHVAIIFNQHFMNKQKSITL